MYLDNAPLELYHDRLDRSQGSIALRLRWYGTGEPNLVFVERKKHHDGWTGEVSVKERFTVAPDAVPSLLSGTYDVEAGAKAVEAKGRGGVEAWRELVGEVMQTINSKQLTPTCRTQYMRTAFQLPHDASVRVSLDTNLTMLAEHGADPSGRWCVRPQFSSTSPSSPLRSPLPRTTRYRDPNVKVPRGERAFFPHAVLEVKLQLVDYSDTPAWLRNLIKSGMVRVSLLLLLLPLLPPPLPLLLFYAPPARLRPPAATTHSFTNPPFSPLRSKRCTSSPSTYTGAPCS